MTKVQPCFVFQVFESGSSEPKRPRTVRTRPNANHHSSGKAPRVSQKTGPDVTTPTTTTPTATATVATKTSLGVQPRTTATAPHTLVATNKPSNPNMRSRSDPIDLNTRIQSYPAGPIWKVDAHVSLLDLSFDSRKGRTCTLSTSLTAFPETISTVP